MRKRGAVLLVLALLVGAAGCTQYQPVAWDGQGGSWAEARARANARRAVPEDLERFLVAGGRRPIAGETVAGSDEGRHLVLPGDTLSEVAERYGTPTATLARINRIAPPFKVYAGQVLAIPPAARGNPRRPAPPPMVVARPTVPVPAPVLVASRPVPRPPTKLEIIEAALAPLEEEPPAIASPPPMTAEELEATRLAAQRPPPPLSGGGFLWPVRGRIASAFGAKPNGARNDGVDIGAAEGTPVVAAENGVVVYAGDEIPGYGRMLLIAHADGFTTAYAHNRDLLVRVGTVVERGQQVATVGRTGGVTAPQLHFELRDGRDPVDPVAHFETARTRLASAR
ncbi:MAG TPA: M23 family metallopeptidase [Geminicoccaceae bacterium]|nr:M23 family metallopeptidase [Geminicoccaceae bacterium]